MKLLHVLDVIFWIFMAYQSIKTFLHLRDSGVSKREILTVTIVVLCALNIGRSFIYLFIEGPAFGGQILLEYFYIGSSVFQWLLSSFTLHYIQTHTNKKD